ncbi:MAG: nucleotide exchange factor GrpE [Saccharofermentans sp.]|nr:nucleotide exchange factor GrpE [Saccharofermentans sp.]
MEENKDEEILKEQEEEVSEEAKAEETAASAEETEETADGAFEKEESAEAEEAAEDSDNKSEELEKRYMSLYAEYDNYRKRTQKEKENLYADAVADVAKEFLAVLDNIDRAVETAKGADENSIDKVIEGIELLGRQAGDILTKIGVEEIKAERGEKFDPNLHEAVMHVEDEDLGEQEIAMVFTKGYMYKGKVIRHVVVQVAN